MTSVPKSRTTTTVVEHVTAGEVDVLTRFAKDAILASTRPAEELTLYAAELEELRSIAEPSAQRAIDRFENIEGILAVFQREASLGRSTASALRKELSRPGGVNPKRLGAPLDAMVVSSLRWGDENGGTVHVGFDKRRVQPATLTLNALSLAMEKLANRLAEDGADAKMVSLFRQRFQAFYV